jgi:hypothetical protein
MSGLAVAGSKLYLAAGNRIGGMEVWYTLDGTTWYPAVFDGFGSANNLAPNWGMSLAVANERLWVGTWNPTNGGQIWQGATAASVTKDQRLYLPIQFR